MLVAAFFIFAPTVYKMNTQQSAVDREIAALKAEIAKAENKNTELKKMIGYLESDSFLDEQARVNFNLKKPGEKVVVVPSGNAAANLFEPATATNTETKGQKVSNYQKWIDYFFKPQI